jgi:membrane protease YdiL (CAAX protease family)
MLPPESDGSCENDEVVLESGPWGFWATVGFGILITTAFTAIQVLIVVAFVAANTLRNPEIDIAEFTLKLESNGLLLGIATCATAVLCTPLIVLFTKLRRQLPVRSYLALQSPSLNVLLKWLGITVLLMTTSDAISFFMSKPIAPEFMIEAYGTAGILPLFWVALVIAAPLFEELFFRGFLFAGFQESRLGVWGTIFLTSLLWASIHTQYDAYQITTIFILGLLFGIARHRSGSIYTTLAMHALVNLVALTQTSYYHNL